MTVAQRETLDRLLYAVRDEKLTNAQAKELESLALEHPEAMRHYLRVVNLAVGLRWMAEEEYESADLDRQIPDPSHVIPSLPTTHYPLPTNFVGGPVFSYLVATVVLCLMMLGAWAYKISHDRDLNVATNSRRSTTSGQPELVFVGRITGKNNCQWSDPNTQTIVGAAVALDREYALSSGLLEITYKTGARVILEGPCTYKVESSAGGFLERGKLTARIAQQGPAASAAGAKPQALFFVKTPTAIVTDLGTEFGVEVAENGDTTSYVFEGKIVVKAGIREVKLGAGESVKVGRVRETHHDSSTTETVRFTHPTATPKFVRRMDDPLKLIDLLDIVAGGNGTGRLRERGIDPTSGKQDPGFLLAEHQGGTDYRRADWHPIIDGVFIPDGEGRGVRLDSAGHAFDGFGPNAGKTIGGIWVRTAEMKPRDRERNRYEWVYSMGDGGEFMPERRGLLCLHANAGITFDLAALRKLHPDARPKLFRATAGVGDSSGVHPAHDPYSVDFWVFVDGQVKFVRKSHTRPDGALKIEVELGPEDRFLTLAATDSDGRCAYDWSVFGDPVLELDGAEPTNSGNSKTSNKPKGGPS